MFDVLHVDHRGKYNVHMGSIYNCRFMPSRIERINFRNEVVLKEGMHLPNTMTYMDAALLDNFKHFKARYEAQAQQQKSYSVAYSIKEALNKFKRSVNFTDKFTKD